MDRVLWLPLRNLAYFLCVCLPFEIAKLELRKCRIFFFIEARPMASRPESATNICHNRGRVRSPIEVRCLQPVWAWLKYASGDWTEPTSKPDNCRVRRRWINC